MILKDGLKIRIKTNKPWQYFYVMDNIVFYNNVLDGIPKPYPYFTVESLQYSLREYPEAWELYKLKQCSCGATKVGSIRHSHWCDILLSKSKVPKNKNIGYLQVPRR